MSSNEAERPFDKKIEQVVKALQTKDYLSAQEYIKSAMLEDCHAPEVQNLLGALAELMGDPGLAGKHYRAANALDPTYKPARRNLDRITSFSHRAWEEKPDLGNKSENEEAIPYILEYDEKNIGHLRKREN